MPWQLLAHTAALNDWLRPLQKDGSLLSQNASHLQNNVLMSNESLAVVYGESAQGFSMGLKKRGMGIVQDGG